MFAKVAFQASVVAIVFLVFSSTVHATMSVVEYENRWCKMLDELRDFPEWEVRDSLNTLLKKEMLDVLQTKAAGAYSFPLLSKKVGYKVSSNKKLRTFCWDEVSGGTWHTYGIVAQFKTQDGSYKTKLLSDGEEMRTGGFTDSAPLKIHLIERNSQTHYLIIGRGTHGGGDHHQVAQVFSIDGNELNRCEDCFKIEGKTVPYYYVQVRRVYEIEMRYDEDTKTLDHIGYERNYEDLSDRQLERRTTLFFNGQYFAIK